MTRRRREVPEEGDLTTAPVKPGEAKGTLTLHGSAEALKNQLAGGDAEKRTEEKPADTNGSDPEKRRFVDALRNSKYLIRVKRMTPREFNGMKTNVEVWQENLPLGYQEIQDQITKDHGGGKYRVAVVDPASNNTICADVFEVDGDPRVPEADLTAEEQERIFMAGKPKTAADLTEDGLDRRARVTARLLEVEGLEAQLEDARKRRDGGGKNAAQENVRIEELSRRLDAEKHRQEIEARDRKHEQEIRELKELIATMKAPSRQEGPSETALILQQMQKAQEAADKRFEALQKQMQDDKLNAILEEVKSVRNRPAQQSGSLLDQAEAMLKLKKLFGWGGDDDDEDAEDDPDDDRPWWEKAIDKLGSKFGDQLVEKFTSMEEKGEKVDREKFLKEMTGFADEIAAEAVAKKSGQRLPQAPAPTLPPPPQVPTAGPVTALPPPPPAGVAPAPGPVVQAPPAAPQQVPAMTVAQEVLLRVSGVLQMIERECELRPNEYVWNYEGAFNSLPEAILEKVCAAPDPITMIDAFAIEYIDAEMLAALRTKIAGNPRIVAWLKVGHDELKEWFAEKLKNPKFDPFAEGEEEVEE